MRPQNACSAGHPPTRAEDDTNWFLQHPAPQRNTSKTGTQRSPLPWGAEEGPSPRKETRFSTPDRESSGSAPSASRRQPGPRLPPRPATAPNREQWPSVLRGNPPHPSKYPALSKLSDFQCPVGMPGGRHARLLSLLFLQNDWQQTPGVCTIAGRLTI